jgi:HEAT repeat protein
MRLAVVLVAGLISLATAISVGGEIQAPKTALVYKLKPDNTYRYDFELRSGEDGDGFLQLDGNVSYTLVAGVERPSLIDDAFNNGDGEGKSSGKPFALRVHGVVNAKMAPAQFVDATLRVTPRGDSFKLQENDYSMLSTTVGSLAFDELPPAKQAKWESNRTRKIVFIDEEVVGFPQRFAMLRYGRYAQLRPESVQLQRTTLNQMNVEEKTSYELVELSDEKAVVKTRLVSSWVSGVSGKKAVDLETTGQYTFDRGRNVIAKGHSQSELRVTSEGIEAKLPFKMAFVLQEVLTAEQMKERAAKLEADHSEAEATRLKESELRVSKAIAVLKETSSKPTDVRTALTTLATARRNAAKPERKEVAALLNKFLKSEDDTVRMAAVRAAQEWATAENIPTLLELLKTTQSYQRSTIIQALGATGGNADVATVLVRLMESSNTRFPASQALQKMGPIGESAVLPLLKSTERTTRDDACQILGEIGGKKSKAALEAIMAKTKEGDFQNIQAKMALDKINERLAADLN